MITEQVSLNENICPKCQSKRLKQWDELNEEEKFFARTLPLSAKLERRERRKHLFCTRCWHETKPFSTIA